MHSVIESMDADFDEYRFSSMPRPKELVFTTSNGETRNKDSRTEVIEPRRSKRQRIEKSFGPDFQNFLVEGSRDKL